jgi:hypothetical protein
VPEELNSRVEHLTAAVEALAAEVGEANDRADNAEKSAGRTRSWLQVIGVAGLASLLVVVVAIAALFAYAGSNRKGLCRDIASRATGELAPTSTEYARSLVRTAADNYRILNCEEATGPLGDIDPDAYRPAPEPTP